MDSVPLSAEDRAILELEGDHIVGHTCKIVVLDPPLPSVDALRSQIESRLGRAPLLRRRLHWAPEAPEWREVARVDLDAHVVESDPAETREALHARIAALFATPLERERPLWRLDAIAVGEALALVWRIHHALADGMTCMRLGEAVLWDPVGPSGADHARANASAAVSPASHEADDRRRRGHLAGFLRREFAESAHRSPFDGAVGSRRSVGFATVPLGALHDAAHRLAGATLNDAVLSVVGGAIRSWLVHHHGHLDPIRLRVPVSMHHEGADAGNRDSFFTLPVSLDEPDPAERLRRIHADCAERKREHDAEEMDGLLASLATLSPALRRFAEQLQGGPRSFALCVSNVPGPRSAVHVRGAPVQSLHCLAEVGRRHALRVAVVSHADKLEFGICADPAVAADVGELARGIEREASTLGAG